ncbi:MAG: recombinase family protein [Methanobacteriota archaeon]|nr:MAG: recombinase family protein [Euryarchaeota archaeon]
MRVSTEEQAESGYSIEAQKNAIERYCQNRSLSKGETWRLVSVYVDDGYSAYNGAKRPQFQKMMKDSEKWDLCIAVWLNRFWRNTRKALAWLDELHNIGKNFVAMDYDMDSSSAMGEFALTMMLALAKLESDQTSERVKKAFDQKFDTDEKAWFTRAPLGYDLDDGRLVVNENEAVAVQKSFQMATSHSSELIAQYLNVHGFRGKQGKPFYSTSITQILRNPVYCGYVYRNGVLKRNGHEPIIPTELYNAVQKAITKRSRRRKYQTVELGADEIVCECKIIHGRGVRLYIPISKP